MNKSIRIGVLAGVQVVLVALVWFGQRWRRQCAVAISRICTRECGETDAGR